MPTKSPSVRVQAVESTPQEIQVIGSEIAIKWCDGHETYISEGNLRAASPSAENRGEVDILGKQHGGRPNRSYHDVSVIDWEIVGNYAIRFEFSDGHRTGIYSYRYLRELAES